MDKPVKFFKNKFIIILLIMDGITVLLLLLFNLNNRITEVFYSKFIYVILTDVLGRITDIFPFSLTEILYIVLIIAIIIRFILAIYRLIKKQRSFKNIFLHFLIHVFIFLSIIFVWFYNMWGFNYYRIGLEDKIEVNKNDDKDKRDKLFKNVLFALIKKANESYPEKMAGYNEKYINIIVNKELFNTIVKLENKRIYPAEKIKKTITGILRQTATLGVISPFLLESHISKDLISSEVPFLLAHEKSHLYGYADETEANYIAFLTCISSDNKYLNYSGYSEVLLYFLSDYRRRFNNKEEFEAIYYTIREEIREDYKKIKERNKKYSNKFTKLLYDIYDLYLKANRVERGIKAYSMVVNMILNSSIYDEVIK